MPVRVETTQDRDKALKVVWLVRSEFSELNKYGLNLVLGNVFFKTNLSLQCSGSLDTALVTDIPSMLSRC